MLKAAQAYFQTQVNTTSQGELLLMLYDGALKYLNQAKGKIQEKDYAAKGILISKALDIIAELDGSLNPGKGGELAEKLHNLYFFCTMRLFNANLKMDLKLIDEVILILTGLRDAYAQIVKSHGGDMPTQADAAPQPTQAAPPLQAPTPGMVPPPSQARPQPQAQTPETPQGKPLARITPKKVPAGQAVPGTPPNGQAARPRPAAPNPEAPAAPRPDAMPNQMTRPSAMPRMGRGASMYQKMSNQQD